MRVDRENRANRTGSTQPVQQAGKSEAAKAESKASSSKSDEFTHADAPASGAAQDRDSVLDGLVQTRKSRKPSSGAAKLKNYLDRHPEKREAVLSAAYPTYSKSAPPSIGEVHKLKDGNYEVNVELHHFPDGKVVGQRAVVVSPDGLVMRVQGGDEHGPLGADLRQQIHDSWSKANRVMHLDWHPPVSALPTGVQFTREPLGTDVHPDGFRYTALVPSGPLTPGAGPGDPSKAKSFYVERTGGFGGMTQICGPFTLSGSTPAPAPPSGPVLNPQVRDAIHSQWSKANRVMHLDWQTGAGTMPVGVHLVREPLGADAHPDGFAYTALIPAGPLSPGAAPGDPNKSKSFWVERMGGFAGIRQICGPFNLTESRVE
jgi:hypothetical protein